MNYDWDHVTLWFGGSAGTQLMIGGLAKWSLNHSAWYSVQFSATGDMGFTLEP